MDYQVVITKEFPSKVEALNFMHFLGTDEMNLRWYNNCWNVNYKTTRTTLSLEPESKAEVVKV